MCDATATGPSSATMEVIESDFSIRYELGLRMKRRAGRLMASVVRLPESHSFTLSPPTGMIGHRDFSESLNEHFVLSGTKRPWRTGAA